MERWHRLGSFVFSLLAGTAMSSSGQAQQPSGTTVRVTPSANASGVTGSRVLDVPGDIYSGDEITTARGGEAQIRFVDETRFVVGPNSRVVIDKFVFNPNRTARSVGLSAIKGSFRFISGRSSSNAYSIKTPTVTIGVRGTAFDMAVRPGGETMVAWLQGTGTICDDPAPNRPQQCVAAAPGSVTIAPPGGGFRNARPGEPILQTFFPYLGPRPGLDPSFQIGTPPGLQNVGPSGGGPGQDDPSDDPNVREPREERPDPPDDPYNSDT